MKNGFSNAQLREQKIIEIKKSMIEKYVLFMSIILGLYSGTFWFVEYKIMSTYLILGAITLQVCWHVLKNHFSAERIVKTYLFIAPLYNFYVIFRFWEYSVVSLVWLVPIPLGAYIFFKKKEVVFFSLYSLVIAFSAIFLANMLDLKNDRSIEMFIRYSDVFLIIANIFIVELLVYYKDKVRDLQLLSRIEEKEKIVMPLSLDDKELEQANSLFEKIEHIMKEDQSFKDSKFNISVLSTILHVNNNYISKSIRLQGFTNFNNYVNTYRVNYVLHLIHTVDLEKVTLMYIYTEAGFVSQSTFNRAFKELKGITPTEYIQNQV